MSVSLTSIRGKLFETVIRNAAEKSIKSFGRINTELKK